jgi:hypothetical protein
MVAMLFRVAWSLRIRRYSKLPGIVDLLLAGGEAVDRVAP